MGLAVGSLGRPIILILGFVVLIGVGLLGLMLSWISAPAWRDLLVISLLVALGVIYSAVRTATFSMYTKETTITNARAIVVSNAAFSGNEQKVYLDLVDAGEVVRVRATLRTIDEFRYGDVLSIDGNLQSPRDDPSFNETGFLRAHGAHGKLVATKVAATGERAGNHFLQFLHDLRLVLLHRLRSISQPERQIVAGVVLGDVASLPAGLQESFRRTGTTHMLVASGANVAILAWMIERLFAGLGFRIGLLLTGLVVLSFVGMTGGDASILRAVVLYLILIIAKLSGRRVHGPTLVAFVALGMALINPWSILFNASFQLSFAAIIGLMVFSDWFASLLPTWWLKEFLVPTLAAEIATLPILLFSFGQLSIISPVVNLVALPLVTPIMIGGVATLFVPWLKPVSWLTEGITSVLLWLVAAGARLSWASVTTDTRRILWSSFALGLFMILCVARYRFGHKKEEPAHGK